MAAKGGDAVAVTGQAPMRPATSRLCHRKAFPPIDMACVAVTKRRKMTPAAAMILPARRPRLTSAGDPHHVQPAGDHRFAHGGQEETPTLRGPRHGTLTYGDIPQPPRRVLTAGD